MKIAHLILAHKNPGQVQRLIRALDHPAFEFFIHVDKKSDEKEFAPLVNDRVHMIRNRTKIFWAGYGTIQATLNGFAEIIPLQFDYINVISGQDFPLKKAGDIYNHISQKKGTEFITCESIEDEWKEAAHRVKKYHFINWRIPGKFRLQKLFNSFMPERKYPLDHKIVGRANWFTITNNAAQYIMGFLKKHPEIVRFFKYSWGADEFIFATILYNSSFKEKIEDNLIYVDWTGQTHGHPRVLRAEDFDRMKASGKLFARKLDENVDSQILDMLERSIEK
jgi:hypothetical protein